jgi:hypothetical protein
MPDRFRIKCTQSGARGLRARKAFETAANSWTAVESPGDLRRRKRKYTVRFDFSDRIPFRAAIRKFSPARLAAEVGRARLIG